MTTWDDVGRLATFVEFFCGASFEPVAALVVLVVEDAGATAYDEVVSVVERLAAGRA